MKESVYPLIIDVVGLSHGPRTGNVDCVIKVEMLQDTANGRFVAARICELLIDHNEGFDVQLLVQVQPGGFPLGNQIHHSDYHVVLKEGLTLGLRRFVRRYDPYTVFGSTEPRDGLTKSVLANDVYDL
jgi:hypothetical protein